MHDTITAEEFTTSRVDGARDRYIIEHPTADVMGPLVVYLHGGLSHAEQGFTEDFDRCFLNLRDEVMCRRGVYVSPEYRGDSWLNSAAEVDLVDLIIQIKSRFGESKVIVTGASMGGTSALILASHHPDLVNGVIALCPATDMFALYKDLKRVGRARPLCVHLAKEIAVAYNGTPDEIPEEYEYRSSIRNMRHLTMPIVLRHGVDDNILPVTHSRTMANALRAAGTPVLYDEIPGGHEAPMVATPWGEYLEFLMKPSEKS